MNSPLPTPDRSVAVAIIGGGPAGLTTATHLAPRIDGEVLVLDRETTTGGIPRHSDHLGYGIRDLKRFITGPAYARHLTATARDAGAILQTESMVTGWAGPNLLQVTSPRGRHTIAADAVVLATGARERPRPARLIPGDRPDGVYTTGQLQNLVHIHHAPVGVRAVVIGAELVSYSAVMTLREAGCRTVAMTTTYPRAESYAAFRLGGRILLDGPVLTRSRVVAIHGKHRVESVEVEHHDTGARRRIDCDTVITTGDWIPDHELARLAGIDIDPRTRGPRVDAALRTSSPGVFAAGNLLHPVDTADGAALDGRHVAPVVADWLTHRDQPPAGPAIITRGPFRWVSPQVVTPGTAPRGDLEFWVDDYRRAPKLRATQDGRVIGEHRTPWPAAPGRVYRAPWTLVADARPGGGDVVIEFA